MFTQKIDCQPTVDARTPPRTRPTTAPTTIEAWLIPRAFPRSFAGKASVIIAALFEKRKADPIACTILKSTSSSPDWERLQRAEPTVNTRPERVEPHPPKHVREPAEVDQDRGSDELVAEEGPDQVEERRLR